MTTTTTFPTLTLDAEVVNTRTGEIVATLARTSALRLADSLNRRNNGDLHIVRNPRQES